VIVVLIPQEQYQRKGTCSTTTSKKKNEGSVQVEAKYYREYSTDTNKYWVDCSNDSTKAEYGERRKKNKSSTCTRTTKYSTTVVKPAVVRLPEPTYRKPVLGVLARVLKYGSRKNEGALAEWLGIAWSAIRKTKA
jgi:hypothetical protein